MQEGAILLFMYYKNESLFYVGFHQCQEVLTENTHNFSPDNGTHTFKHKQKEPRTFCFVKKVEF